MARKSRVPLNVLMNGRMVGQLRQASGGAIDFRYHQAWLELENAIPVSLSLPLREDRYTGDPVVAVFDNLLPDSKEIRKKLAGRSQAQGTDVFSLLSATGRDCIGALQFLPDGLPAGNSGAISGRSISDDEIATMLANLHRDPLGVGDDSEFRISLAGMQEKTALLFWNSQWHVPHGTTATTHIFKPAIGKLLSGIDLTQSVENEYLCLKLVSALGIPTAKAEMAQFGETKVLVVERFDRLWTKDRRLLRLPQEDCCQALSVPSHLKYQSDGGPGISDISGLLQGSDTPEADRHHFLKAQIIFFLLCAADGHAKNFSLMLESGGRFHLAPLYDVMSAQPNLDAGQIQKQQARLAMSVGKNRHYIIGELVARHFAQSAALCKIPAQTFESIVSELRDGASDAIDSVLAQLPAGFPEPLATSITTAAKVRLAKLIP